jgi:two-component system chemotaxis sensor kinase CheA
MSLSAQVREQLLSSFRAELNEHIQTLTDGLLAVEQHKVSGEQRQSTLADIFRAAHSLKGASRAMGVTMIEQLAHALESVLDGMRHETVVPSAELFTTLYQALDAIQSVQAVYEAGEITPPAEALQALANLEPFRPPAGSKPSPQVKLDAPPMETPPAAPSPPPTRTAIPPRDEAPQQRRSTPSPGPVVDETIRVSVSKLDALMALLSELLVAKIRAEQRLAQVHHFQEFVAQWQREWLTTRSVYARLARHDAGDGNSNGSEKELSRLLDYVGDSQEWLREMGVMVGDLAREYASDSTHMSLVVDELDVEIKRARMMPLSTITATFARMVRDLARDSGKEASLRIVGADTEMDKRVLEQIKDPLIHLLRNAVDHGIESPEQREAAGKPRRGNITLTAEQLGKDVVISVSDDGAGLDVGAIRQAAARHMSGNAQALSEADLAETIFSAGVSTKPIITDISGRGVGLDVVRRNVDALHGRINVDWTPGNGATFTLTLPLALTSSHGLLVRVSGQVLAIPLGTIERITSVAPQEVVSLEGYDTVHSNGRPLTLVRLCDVLDLPRPGAQQDDAPIPVVILSAAERRIAFAVDELVGEQEMVMKGLGKQLKRVGGIAGATVMGSGDVVLILNVADLIRLATRGERRSVFESSTEAMPSEAVCAQRNILIVDDSVTTRTLEKNILEAAGYSVHLATDGQEALNAIALGQVPDLIVSDVHMPRVSGFELTRRIKDDPLTAHVPVILVTSLDTTENKTQGIEAGADAYITKGKFDQANLLETIEQLI